MQKHQTVSLWTHECPGLPNIPISLHEAVWLLSPFPFQNTFFARAPAEPLAAARCGMTSHLKMPRGSLA